jgi:D-arabinitol 4-dehydrogenase
MCGIADLVVDLANRDANLLMPLPIPTTKKWMLHLGLGAFHRAHQAWYFDCMAKQGDSTWALASGNIRPDMPQLLGDLEAQGGRYTLATITPAGVFNYECIDAIGTVLPWSEDLHHIVAQGRKPETCIISFTVTEAGYFLDQEGRLDLSHADLRMDLDDQGRRSIYGAMRAILHARRVDEAGPVTLLCCDNVRSNGRQFRTGLLDFLDRCGDLALRDWVRINTSCPDSMVDRITPRPPADLAQRVLQATGIVDKCAVMAEDFSQWVIEDDFIQGRPAWENVGVQMVASVSPYEEAKIRILNGTHSCLAWAGALAGHTYIHEALADTTIRKMAWEYITADVIPCLAPSPVDLEHYRDTVLERFGNAPIRDTVERVAADGFAKLPGFIAPTIGERVRRGERFDASAVLPALFLLFLEQRAAGKIAFAYSDKAVGQQEIDRILDARDVVQAFCSSEVLWGALAGNPVLEAGVRAAYGGLRWGKWGKGK